MVSSKIMDAKSSVVLKWILYELDAGNVGSHEYCSFKTGGMILGIKIEVTDDGIPWLS